MLPRIDFNHIREFVGNMANNNHAAHGPRMHAIRPINPARICGTGIGNGTCESARPHKDGRGASHPPAERER